MNSDLYSELVGIPWWVWLVVAALAGGAYLLAQASVDYNQLDDPDYLDERTEYEARKAR